MKKNVHFICLTVIFSCILFFVFGCGGNKETPQVPTFTYYYGYELEEYSHGEFYTWIGINVDSLENVDIKTVSREGYEFLGGFNAREGGIQYFDETGKLVSGMTLSEDLKIYGRWKKKMYNLCLYNGNEKFREMSVEYDAVLSTLEVPSTEGYTFNGWYTEMGIQITDSEGYVLEDRTTFCKNSGYDLENYEDEVKLVANFTIKKYTITYDFGGFFENVEKEVSHGSRLELLKVNQERKNYQFMGWSYSNSATNPQYYNQEEIKWDTVLYAIWLPYKDFTFVYDGTTIATKRMLDDGSVFNLNQLEADITPGYRINAFYSNSGMSGGSKITNISYGYTNTTIYVTLEPIIYTINLHIDGETVLSEDFSITTYTVEDEIALPEAYKEYFTYMGWCTEEACSTTPMKSISVGTIGNLELYPRLKGDDKKISYDSREGTLSAVSDVVEYGANYQLKVPTIKDYAFVGWFTIIDDMEIQLTNSKGESLERWNILTDEVVVFAKYDRKYYITLIINDNTMGTVEKEEYYVQNETVSLQAVPVTGHSLVGFYIGNQLMTESDIYRFKMPNKNITIYVVFEANEYTIKLNTDGGILEDNDSITVTYGQTVVLPSMSRSTYRFLGWEYNGKVYDTFIFEFTDSIEFTAKWEKITGSIEIKTITDFLSISEEPHKYYFLVADLDFSKGNFNFSKINYITGTFSGTFDGMNHTIRGLENALFNTISGEVFNLKIEVNINASNSRSDFLIIGGLARILSNAKIHDVVVEGSIKTSGNFDTGGIAGLVKGDSTQVYNCTNKARVEGTHSKSGGSAGGIIGVVRSSFKLENNMNYGDVICSDWCGGIIGFTEYTNAVLNIVSCKNYGNISGSGSGVGGLSGYNSGSTIIKNCENRGTCSNANGKYAGSYKTITYNLSPIEIRTAEEFLILQKNISAETFVLVNNLDFTALDYKRFTLYGTLDGQGYKITGLQDALFDAVSGEVFNLTIEIDAHKTNDTNELYRLGGLANTLNQGAKVHDVIVEGVIETQGRFDSGGVAGAAESNVNVYNCVNKAILQANPQSSDGAYFGGSAGGIIGACFGSNSQIKNNTNEGAITSKHYAGGIIGYACTVNVVSCTNLGDVLGSGEKAIVGGLIGAVESKQKVTISKGKMSGTSSGGKYVGSGSASYVDMEPIEIYTKEDLLNMQYYLSFESFVLMNDIDMQGVAWTPFALDVAFNGNGYTIYNLVVTSSDGDAGMFSQITGNGKVSNLNLEASITSTASTKVYLGGLCGELSGMVENVTVRGNVIGSYADIGGIAGYLNGGTIRNCTNYATITGNSTLNGAVGGILGYHPTGSLTQCVNYGTVSNLGENTGGIIGYISWSNGGLISDLTNSGNISGGEYVGGIVGNIDNSMSTKSGYTLTLNQLNNSGTVSGNGNVGGIIGRLYCYNSNNYSGDYTYTITGANLSNTADITGTSYVGGLTGYAYAESKQSKISESYSSGHITAEYIIGGLCGRLENIQLDNCQNEGTVIEATGYQLDGTNYYAYIGGYTGYGYSITNCENKVDIVYNERGFYVGGIAGYTTGSLQNCKNYGNITANRSTCVGGISGYNCCSSSYSLLVLTNSGNISGGEYVGGIVGNIDNSMSTKSGYTLTLNQLNNSGTVSGNGNVGGIIGRLYCYNSNNYSGDYTYTITGANLSNTADITGTSYVGGLIGYAYAESKQSKISESYSSGHITAEYIIGGLCGRLENIQLDNCQNEGTVIEATGYQLDGTNYYAYIGGYTGYGYSITNCENKVDIVYNERGFYVGGIAGYTTGSLQNCKNYGNITANRSTCVGGISGYNCCSSSYSLLVLTNSGNISGGEYVGGIVGNIDNSMNTKSGYTLTLNQLNNSGTVSGNGNVGGIIGRLYCYNSNNYSGDYTYTITGANLSNTADITGTSYVGGLIGYAYVEKASSIVDYIQTGIVVGTDEYVDDYIGYTYHVSVE